MSFEVSPDDLRAAARALSSLHEQIDGAPNLDAESAARTLTGSRIALHLGRSDQLSRTARDLLKERFDEFSAALTSSADNFEESDLDAADRIADFGSADPHRKA